MGEGCVTIELAGESLTLMPERAAWWAAARTLVVADLHLGKSETMRVAGLPVPDIDLDEQFDRLEKALGRCGAGVARLIVVGDLMHAPAGLTEAMGTRVAGRFERLRSKGVRTVLVRGNHDRRIGMVDGRWGLEVCEELDEDVFTFAHEPRVCQGRACVAGHLHPALPVGSIKAPSFVVGSWGMVLPAFSRFTAGGRIAREPGQRWFPIADGSVMELGVRRHAGVARPDST